jgi:hypothetical protein
MAFIPKHTTSTVTRHIWTIGDGNGPIIARELRDGIYFAQKAMEEMGIDISTDDAYKVIGDDYQVDLIVDVEE